MKEERDEALALATELVDHVAMMGAEGCYLPVTDRAKEYTVRVALTETLGREKSELAQLRATIEALTRERDEARAKQPINTNLRLFDLVRYMRAELHEQGLITNSEYATLCAGPMATGVKGGSPSRQRLEDYDALRAQLAASEKDRERLDWLEKQNTQRELTWGNGSGPSGITTARLTRYISLGRVKINLDTGEPGSDLPIPTLRAAIDAAMKEAK